jgi:hypothetical protein
LTSGSEYSQASADTETAKIGTTIEPGQYPREAAPRQFFSPKRVQAHHERTLGRLKNKVKDT